jgi:hypothetical protein
LHLVLADIFLFTHWFFSQCYALVFSNLFTVLRTGSSLVNLNLIAFILSPIVLGRGLFDILESKARELLGWLDQALLETNTDPKLVVDEPDLVNLDDALDALTLLDGSHVYVLALVVVRLGHKLTRLGVVEHLELDGGWVVTLSRCDNGLVQSLLDDRDAVLLAEPLLGVVSHHLDDDIIERLHLVHEVLYERVGVKRQGECVRRLLGRLVSEGAQAKGCAHLGNLQVNLGGVGAVEVHSATTILILANLGKDDSGRREISRLLN